MAVCYALSKIGMKVTLVSRKQKPGNDHYIQILIIC